MTVYYELICKELKLPEDNKLIIEKMKAANAKDLKAADDRILDAQTNFGETEIRDSKLAKANLYAIIGNKNFAIDWYDQTMKETVCIGSQIDLVFAVLDFAFCNHDIPLIRKNIIKAKGLVEKSEDFERRNKFRIYKAIFLVMTRNFQEAAKLFLDSAATFSAFSLFNYERFVFYTVLASMMTLDRVSIKNTIKKSTDILAILRNSSTNIGNLFFSLCNCDYRQFLMSLDSLTPLLKRDKFMAPHVKYCLRELRVIAYSQFLQSYRTATLQSIATAFGVSVEFIEVELSGFINSGRISAKIDAIGKIIETISTSNNNAQYTAIIKCGDVLLHRLQKLSKMMVV